MVFDIAQMGEQIRAVGLQVILEYVWQRVVANKRRGVRTWVWIDEFSIMFNDGAGRTTHKSGEFFSKVYKRIRKYGGVPTAMTQNITEVLESSQARTLMKLENKVLGTAATRASIINALFAREYIAKKGKTIYPTEKGKTTVIKGFKSKAGKEFDAALKLDKTTGKIEFEFPKKKK